MAISEFVPQVLPLVNDANASGAWRGPIWRNEIRDMINLCGLLDSPKVVNFNELPSFRSNVLHPSFTCLGKRP